MSIKTQKIIAWIPIVNFAVFIFFFWSYYRSPYFTTKKLMKTILLTFVCVFLIVLPRGIVAANSGNFILDEILFYLNIYLIPLLFDFVVIHRQAQDEKEAK